MARLVVVALRRKQGYHWLLAQALERQSPIPVKRWRSTHDLVKSQHILGRETVGIVVVGHDARRWLDRCGVKPSMAKGRGIRTVYVAAAEPMSRQVNLRACRGFDTVVLCQNEGLDVFREANPKARVIGTHLCAEQRVYKPYPDEAVEFDVGFVGTFRKVAKGKKSPYYWNRWRWMHRLAKDGFSMTCRQGPSGEEAARILSRCKIGFHHSNRGWWKKPGDYPPAMRVFEVMAAGRLLVCDRFRLNGLKLVEGQHYVAFKARDYQAFRRLVRHYVEHDEERERIAEAGRQFVLANHTYDHRARLILRELGLEARSG